MAALQATTGKVDQAAYLVPVLYSPLADRVCKQSYRQLYVGIFNFNTYLGTSALEARNAK